eukprot:SM005477S18192  [mRNA]  locus=s5477:74:734:- [translate_table: standard]
MPCRRGGGERAARARDSGHRGRGLRGGGCAQRHCRHRGAAGARHAAQRRPPARRSRRGRECGAWRGSVRPGHPHHAAAALDGARHQPRPAPRRGRLLRCPRRRLPRACAAPRCQGGR